MTPALNKVSDSSFNSSKQPLSREALEAGAALRPCFQAASSIIKYNRVLGKLDLMAVVDELDLQINKIKIGDMGRAEETLAGQGIVLDNLFHCLVSKALQAPGLDMQAIVIKLVLQAQKQCCQTFESIAGIKNPRTVTVMSQTNIGQAVQVNSRGDNISKPDLENELLEHSHGERLDFGTQGTASGANQNLATMEMLDGSQN